MVVALADDLPTANYDAAVSIVKWRLVGLDEAERLVGILARRHIDCGWSLYGTKLD
jgi:hypothetical protein